MAIQKCIFKKLSVIIEYLHLVFSKFAPDIASHAKYITSLGLGIDSARYPSAVAET